MFDEYLTQDTALGTTGSNYARDQLQAQQMLAQARKKVDKADKRNVAVETEATGAWMSNATIASILPPDIYMSLRFPDQQQQQQQVRSQLERFDVSGFPQVLEDLPYITVLL